MVKFKRRDIKFVLKAGAKARGLSLSEFRAEIHSLTSEESRQIRL